MMTSKYFQLLIGLVGFWAASSARGHGVPITVEVVGGQLIVTGGAADDGGFASQLFYDDSPDGMLDQVNSPVLGAIAVTDRPGFNILGVDPGSGLYLEAMARPVLDSNPPETRFLWHWNHVTEEVDVTPALDVLRILSDFGSITLPQADGPVPAALQIAEPLADDLGEHVHFLRYLLDDSPTATLGAYGFFARVTSPNYDPSDPFLIVLNHGVDETLVETGARAINAAAVDLEPILGDYDTDGQVTVADYEFWKLHFGESVAPFASADGNGNGIIDAADYTVWRDAESESSSGIGAVATPEPATALLALLSLGCSISMRIRQTAPPMAKIFCIRTGPARPALAAHPN